MSWAIVFCWVASDPDSGSERQKAPIVFPLASGLKYLFFCSSVPYSSIPQQANELCADNITEHELSIFEIYSTAIA